MLLHVAADEDTNLEEHTLCLLNVIKVELLDTISKINRDYKLVRMFVMRTTRGNGLNEMFRQVSVRGTWLSKSLQKVVRVRNGSLKGYFSQFHENQIVKEFKRHLGGLMNGTNSRALSNGGKVLECLDDNVSRGTVQTRCRLVEKD